MGFNNNLIDDIDNNIDLEFNFKSEIEQTNKNILDIDEIKKMQFKLKFGAEPYINKYLLKEKEIRRHRKKRINNKLIKKYGKRIIKIPDDKIFILNDCNYFGCMKIICHPKIFNKLLNE